MTSEFGRSNEVLTYEALQKMTGYNTPMAVISSLESQGIKFKTGKRGRPYTTLGAVELSMGVTLLQAELLVEKKPPKLGLKKRGTTQKTKRGNS